MNLLPIKLINVGTPGLEPLEGDLSDKYVVVAPDRLKERLRFARNQIMLAKGGFGCSPTSLGSKVFGVDLNGDEDVWRRNDLIGIASAELVERAKLDKSEAKPLDKTLRCYMAIGPGYFGKGETIAAALRNLGKAMGRRSAPRFPSKKVSVYYVHPEAYINDFCQLVSPADVPIKEVK